MIPYGEFERTHQGLTREQFLERVRVPYVVVEGPASRDGEGEQTKGFRTVKFTASAVEDAVNMSSRGLLPVQKREGSNAFGMMITMGRANNNDLVIPDQRISKFHAYFRQVGAAWHICDANSRNGTYMNGLTVPQEQGLRLESGARIKLAKTLELTFLSPEGLYDLLHAPA